MRKQIRDRRTALAENDGGGYVSLLRLLNAVLEVDRLSVEIRRGSFRDNLPKLNRPQKHQLLNLAERWAAADSEIARILNSFTPDELKQGSTAVDVAAARHRLSFRAALRTTPLQSTPLVSLGAHCLAWTLPNRWGMRPAADIPRLFNPFALAVHRPEFLARMLASDFEGYLDPAMLQATVSTGGYGMVARKDGAALWNHCVGPYWTGSKFRRFIASMEEHLQRFRDESLAEGPPFRVFLLHLPNAVNEKQAVDQTMVVADALAGRVAGAHAVLAIDTGQRDEAPLATREIAPGRAILRAPIPKDGYRWPMAESYNSPRGLAYEQGIAEEIGRTVATWAQSHD